MKKIISIFLAMLITVTNTALVSANKNGTDDIKNKKEVFSVSQNITSGSSIEVDELNEVSKITTENKNIETTTELTTEFIDDLVKCNESIEIILDKYFGFRNKSFIKYEYNQELSEYFDDIIISDEQLRSELISDMEDRMKIHIVNANTTFNITNIQQIDNKYIINIYEWILFNYDDLEDDKYNEDTSGYGVNHIITIFNENNIYRIHTDQYEEFNMTGMQSSSYDYDKYLNEINQSNTDTQNESISENDKVNLFDDTVSDVVNLTAANYSGYNPSAAVTYADQYALNYNSAYRSYASSGGDCANFVSQCLRAGGLPTTSSWYAYSSAWVSAGGQRTYMANTYGQLITSPSASDIQAGNPVYYPSSVANSGYHATICVGKNSAGTPIINSHTGDQYHVKYTYMSNPSTVKLYNSNINNPQGTVDSVTGGTGYINVRGWAFDKDDTSKALAIHVYTGGPAGVGEGYPITANASRPDVNTAYGCGNNHGFDAKIPTKKTGTQTVYIYAINVGSGDNTLIGTKSVTINKDSTIPKISNVKVSQSSTGYTVTCTATDTGSGIEKVQFPTWTTNKGQDDILASWQTNSKASGTRNGNTFTYTVKYSDHNNEKGEYNTHIYAYDFSGNIVSYSLKVVPTTAPTGYSISVNKNNTFVYNNDTNNQVTVYCTVKNGVSCKAKLIVEKNGSVYGTYDFGSGKSISNSIVFTETGTYEVYFELSNDGGSFKGAKGNGSQTITVTEKPKTYTVSYNANGGSGAPSKQTKTHGTNLTLSSTKPTRTGYSFVKWNTKADGSGTSYSPGASYSVNTNVTLYAIWNPYKHTVSYNANGGTGAPASQTKTYGVTMNISTNKPTRTGYSFQGWATSATGTVKYQSGASYTSDQNGGTVTLYAVWKAITYTVTYNANGGSGAPASQTKTYGQ